MRRRERAADKERQAEDVPLWMSLGGAEMACRHSTFVTVPRCCGDGEAPKKRRDRTKLDTRGAERDGGS